MRAVNTWTFSNISSRDVDSVVVNFDDVGRPEPEPAVSEVETLLGFLNFQRATLKWKCAGLGSGGLNVSVGVSTMTLGGLLKHMTFVENEWFWRWLGDNERLEPWLSIDWEQQPDWEFASAFEDSPDILRNNWESSVVLSNQQIEKFLSVGGLDGLALRTWPSGESPSLRWILVHMIEEYARHNGHADLMREVVDGQTGE
jgi:uncharacterized damage-inducible protein DinB